MNSTQLLIVLNETQHVIDKYSADEWSSDPIAQDLVTVSAGYHAENEAELTQVMPTEQNCSPNPCANGICEEGQNQYEYWYSHRCICEEGWWGPFCDWDINECTDNDSCVSIDGEGRVVKIVGVFFFEY